MKPDSFLDATQRSSAPIHRRTRRTILNNSNTTVLKTSPMCVLHKSTSVVFLTGMNNFDKRILPDLITIKNHLYRCGGEKMYLNVQ
jgi:hypothetical protein